MKTIKIFLFVIAFISISNSQSHSPIVDIRDFGAVCDGTDQNTAVQAALATGAKWLYIPANCLWVVPGSVIPSGLTITGEDWFTSMIKFDSTVTRKLKASSGVKLYNLNLLSFTASETANQTAFYCNSSDTVQNIVSTAHGVAITVVGGITNFDNTPAFFQVIRGNGDAINGSSGEPGKGGGNGGRFDVYPSGAGALRIDRHGTSVYGIGVNDDAYLGKGCDGQRIGVFTNCGKHGEIYGVNQRDSVFDGTVYDASMADVSGDFIGYFANWKNHGELKFSVDYRGYIKVTLPRDPSGIEANTLWVDTAGIVHVKQ